VLQKNELNDAIEKRRDDFARLEQERQAAMQRAIHAATVLQAPTKVRTPFKLRTKRPIP
jgi:hypothetical protein